MSDIMEDFQKPYSETLDEATIDQRGKGSWGNMPCDLEGDDLGVHARLVIKHEANGAWAVTDCDRKNEPR